MRFFDVFNRRSSVVSWSALAGLSGLLCFTAVLSSCGGSDASDSAQSENVTVPTLTGRAVIAADTFVAGPTSGQFINGGDLTTALSVYGYSLPFVGKQPVQGISALARNASTDVLYALQDNGFGGKSASPDALLHIYAFRPDWVNGKMNSVDFATGAATTDLNNISYIRLADPDKKLSIKIVADGATYAYPSFSPAGNASTIGVDPMILSKRLLTGADIDPESMVIDADGNFWIGEEFGPWLIKVDKAGKILQSEISIPNVLKLDSNPYVQTSNNPNATAANLPSSGGLESMAINPSKTRIYTMFERELSNDTNKQRRIMNVFDITANKFLTDVFYQYKVGVGTYINASGATVTEYYTPNDMTAVNDHQFLVVEKDRGAGDARTGNFPDSRADRVAAKYKKIFLVDLNKIDADGFLVKTELVDLMNLADPKNIGGSDTIKGVFALPMESIESVRILDANTLVVVNDNNYPGGSASRNKKKPDPNEFIRIRLPVPLSIQ